MDECISIKAEDNKSNSCSGGEEYELSDIPCSHALRAIINQKQYPFDFVSLFYSVDSYKIAYESAIMSMSDDLMNQGIRERGQLVHTSLKSTNIYKGTKCHEKGHNAITCKVTKQNTGEVENSSDAPQQHEENANANIPNRREKLKVTKKNTGEVGKSCDAPQESM
ncbi:3-bisphosphoglycerate-dependent phosphoglyceratemutase, partial [Striga asiatica]